MKNVLICREKSIANEKSLFIALYRCLAPGENQAYDSSINKNAQKPEENSLL